MLNKLIYELTKVYVYDFVEGSRKNIIDCRSVRSGYFDSFISTEDFIHKHNKDENCFFIARAYIFNASHAGQTEDYLFERTYDYNGNLLCDCPTYHFVVNFNELYGEKPAKFIGRDNPIVNKDEQCWFYNEYEKVLQKCKIGEVPFNTEQAKQYDCLDWYDDSYIVYPMPMTQNVNNHQHIISCYIFSDEQVKKMMPVY